MAKELPYYKEEPAEYLAGDISFCSLEAQGLFSVLKSYYWLRSCRLTKTQFLKRSNHVKEFNELVENGIIDVENDKIIIKFMLFQLNEIQSVSKQKSLNGSKGGRPKKTETKANQKLIESKTKAIREDKIKEDNIINSNFSEICLNDAQWMEVTSMQNKGKNIKEFISKFDKHLITLQEQKRTVKEYKQHFTFWLAKQPKQTNGKINLGI